MDDVLDKVETLVEAKETEEAQKLLLSVAGELGCMRRSIVITEIGPSRSAAGPHSLDASQTASPPSTWRSPTNKCIDHFSVEDPRLLRERLRFPARIPSHPPPESREALVE